MHFLNLKNCSLSPVKFIGKHILNQLVLDVNSHSYSLRLHQHNLSIYLITDACDLINY